MPRLSKDDVTDFMVTEAVVMRGIEERAEAEKAAGKQREVEAWRRNAASELPG